MNSRGFTLVELIAAIGVMALLAALLFPMAGQMVVSSNQTKCASHLRQVYQAMLGFANDNNGLIVRGMGETGAAVWSDALAPYVGMNPTNYGHPYGTRPQGVFACPASKKVTAGGSRSDFGSNFAVNGDSSTPPLKLASLSAPSKTIAFIDSGVPTAATGIRSVASWMGSTWGIEFRHGDKKPNNSNRANAVFFDGHVEALSLQEIPLGSSAFQRSPWAPNPIQ